MLMLDVRNAIAAILDRYTLADVVEVTTRKLITSGLPLPYTTPVETTSGRQKARQGKSRSSVNNPTEGVIHQLLGDYAI
jgi:hypothetical protein